MMRGPLKRLVGWSEPVVLALLAGLCVSGPGWAFDPNTEPTAEQVVERMMEMDRCTTPALRGYTSIRQYHLENKRFGKTANMTVRLTFHYPGHKEFQVLSEEGSAIIRKRVLRKLLDSELEASSDALREATQITPRNYSFRLAGIEDLDGRKSFVLDASPKASNRYLFRGKVWVDADDYSIARIEASPAQNPSIWIRKTSFIHQYRKVGQFWLPVSNRSKTDALVFGRTDVTIEYSDYRINPEAAQPPARSCQ
jgi:outer membrane lipoprotein-sorting protein